MNSSDGTNVIYEVTEYDEVWREKITSSFTESLSPISYEGNYNYYENGNLWTSSTQYNSSSRSNTYTYDFRNNMLTDTDSIRGLTSYTYDNNDNITSVSGPSGNIGFTYTGRDLVETFTIGSDTHTFNYDGNGNVSTFTDPFNHVTTYTYDGYDRLKTVSDALSNQTVFSRFNYGNTLNIKRYNSSEDLLRETIRINDPLGRLTSYTVTMPDGEDINYIFAYENEGSTVIITDPLGRESKVYKNEYGRVWKEEDAAGNITDYFYEDGRGNMTKKIETVKSADGSVTETYETTYVYNAHNKIERITEKMPDSDDFVTEFYYDQMGNLTGTKDAEGNKITHVYDGLGRRVKTIKHFNNGQDITTEFTWYSSNKIHTIKDDKGNITEYQYDSQNRTKKIIYPDDTFIEYTYDKVEAGKNQDNETVYYRVVEEKQRNGTVVKNFYDQLQRLMKREITPGTDVEGTTLETYAYDGLSRVTKATDDDSEVEFGYDRANRLKWEKQMGKLIEYTYDKVNNLRSIKYPNTRLIEREFDQLNRINKIKEGSVNIADMTHIGRSYRLLNKQYGNGDLINYLYDHGRRLISKETKNKNEDLINKYVYRYNKVHMKTFEQRGHDNDKGDVFGYDDVYRLKDITFNADDPINPVNFDKKKSVQFDKVDNILKILTIEGAETTEIYTTIEDNNAKLNQYTTFDQWGMDYDLNGNTTQKGIQKFYYDYRNQMVSAVENGVQVNFKYDAMGRRIEKGIGSNTVKYFYSGNQVIEERDNSDNVLKQYIYGNGIDEISRMDKNENGAMISYYFHTNSIGSVTAITDQNGNLIERINYDLYGMSTFTDYQTYPQNPTVVGSSVIGNDILFQGRRYDKETNLLYFRDRYYDPIMGRFLQTDPIGYKDSMNIYQAFNMNPVNFVDPFGLREIFVFFGEEGMRNNWRNETGKTSKRFRSYTRDYKRWFNYRAEKEGHKIHFIDLDKESVSSAHKKFKDALNTEDAIIVIEAHSNLKDAIYLGGQPNQKNKARKYIDMNSRKKISSKIVAIFACNSSKFAPKLFLNKNNTVVGVVSRVKEVEPGRWERVTFARFGAAGAFHFLQSIIDNDSNIWAAIDAAISAMKYDEPVYFEMDEHGHTYMYYKYQGEKYKVIINRKTGQRTGKPIKLE